jgi:hypothetical protein
MPNLSALKAIIACGGVGTTRPRGHANRNYLTVLLEGRTWSLLSWALELLGGALKLLLLLLLALTPTRASWTKWCTQR